VNPILKIEEAELVEEKKSLNKVPVDTITELSKMTLNKNQLKNNNKKLLLKKNLKNKHSLWKNTLLIKLKLPLIKKITSAMKSINKPLLN